MLKICFSNSNVTKSLQKYSRKLSLLLGVDILKRCSSYMGVLLYTIERSLAKLNIKHRMCCDKPIDYKMLTRFFLDITAWLYGEEVTPIYWHVGCSFLWHSVSAGK